MSLNLADQGWTRDETNLLQELFDLASDAEGDLDKDTYDQHRAADFDAPDDAELCIRAGTERKITKVFALIDKLRKDLTDG